MNKNISDFLNFFFFPQNKRTKRITNIINWHEKWPDFGPDLLQKTFRDCIEIKHIRRKKQGLYIRKADFKVCLFFVRKNSLSNV